MTPETILPKKDQAANPAPPDSSNDDGLRTFTRLVVGAAEIGIKELRLRLRRWEEELDQAQSRRKTGSSQAAPEELVDHTEGAEPKSEDILRYALIGMMFDAQEMVKSGSVKVVKVGRRVQRRTSPILRPIASSRLLSPARRRYKRFVSRGQRKVDQWIAIGRQEEIHSRMLAQTALAGTVDETVDYLAEMPGVQELITTQTTSLAGEVVEEIRERTVAADILMEGLARALFRRKPRYTLPPPPPAVQMSAVTLRATQTHKNSTGRV